jgi:hypothetical protein
MEKLPAALTLIACIVLLVRMSLGDRSRRRMDHAGSAAWGWLSARAYHLWHWRESRRRAAREAEDAIERARKRMAREGNVYRPDAFQEPRKPH